MSLNPHVVDSLCAVIVRPIPAINKENKRKYTCFMRRKICYCCLLAHFSAWCHTVFDVVFLGYEALPAPCPCFPVGFDLGPGPIPIVGALPRSWNGMVGD